MTEYRFREWDSGGARTGRRPHARILDAFRSPANVAAITRALSVRLPPGPLRDHATQTAKREIHRYSMSGGLGEDVLKSDPLAQRGRRGATGITLGGADELARLNRAFVAGRLKFVRDNAELITKGKDARDNEPYHMQMFADDSLRPPGLEGLNDGGPLWEYAGDQRARPFLGGAYPDADPAVAECDRAWAPGDGGQTAEETIAEYWGEGAAETMVGRAGKPKGPAEDAEPKISHGCGKADPSRFMRYREIPRWQHTAGALDGQERDVNETLGDGNREMGNHVRRWGGYEGSQRPREYRKGIPFKFNYRAYAH